MTFPPSADTPGTQIVITGKGGVGKTTLTALLAHILARQGIRVLAVDGDPQRNLAATLGIPLDEAERIIPVTQRNDYLQEKTGAGPNLTPGGLLALNPDISDVANRFSVPVTENLRLLVMGSVRMAGGGCLCPEYTLLAAILRDAGHLPDQVILLDTPAGLEHFGRAIADGFSTALVISDPSYNAGTVARESVRLARELGIREIWEVVNQATCSGETRSFAGSETLSADYSRVVYLPFDPVLLQTEPSVMPVLDRDSAFVSMLRELAGRILCHRPV